ncbi:MAG: hypothetical protein IKG69_08565 [Atopobiaceae bacterium]|nr:hypothetical protein [Atopobiaceae bacterium]
MANNQNLKGHEFTSEQSREEAAENGRKGGIASGAARRTRRAMRDALDELLSNTYQGADGRELDGTTLLMIAAVNKARKGDMRALEFIRSTIGEDPVKQVDVTGNLRAEQARFNELLEQLGEDRA